MADGLEVVTVGLGTDAGGAVFGVMVIDARHDRALQSIVLSLDDWQAVISRVQFCSLLAGMPGELPDARLMGGDDGDA